MCQAASMILLQDKVLIGRITNSHSEILRQHNIEDKRLRPNFVKIEIIPWSENYNSPFKDWEYNIDQDYIPDWYVPGHDNRRARRMLKTWHAQHVIGQSTDAPNQTQKTKHNSTQTAGIRAKQAAGDWATQTADERSTQTAGIRANQRAGVGAKQTAGNGTTQKAGPTSIQMAGDWATQTAGFESTQTAGDRATQRVGPTSIQTAGDRSTQEAGIGTVQTAGIGTVQIIRHYNDGWQVKTRIITEKQANRPYKFFKNNWHLVK